MELEPNELWKLMREAFDFGRQVGNNENKTPDLPLPPPPLPTWYSRKEGEAKEPWDTSYGFDNKGPGGAVHAIWFSDGSVFDTVTGWRPKR